MTALERLVDAVRPGEEVFVGVVFERAGLRPWRAWLALAALVAGGPLVLERRHDGRQYLRRAA